MNNIDALRSRSKDKFDLTEQTSHQHLYALTNELLDVANSEEVDFDNLIISPESPLEFRIALHLLRSKQFLNTLQKPIKVGIVFAMWGEQNRLQPKSSENQNGEDTLRTKIDQLNWATQGTPVEWRLYVVDDGCPHDSGAIAEKIISQHPDKDKVKILYLNDYLAVNTGPLKNLATVNDSRKGGAIILGAQTAIADKNEVIIYTDADNSVHLGQIGILLKPYLEDGFKVVLGNRKDPAAVLVKQENRWGIGIKVLRHMQRMVGESIFSRGILDSQAAFKLYEAELLSKIIKDPAVYDFSFDSDWIAASIQMGEEFAKVPFAFVDSFAESASIVQGPMSTWETLLLGLVKVVQHRHLPHNEAMAKVLQEEINSAADLDLLINNLPPALESVNDKELGSPLLMSPEEVQEWIKAQKRAVQ